MITLSKSRLRNHISTNKAIFIEQLLDMVERNELDRSLLTLLDENIADAHKNDQVRKVGCFLFFPLLLI